MVPKMFIVLTVLLLAYCNASTLPDASEPLSKPQDTEESAPSASVNVPQCSETAITEAPSKEDLNRITCDLFNSGQLCAAHCILHGNAGGYCDSKKVCVCRKRSNDPIEQSDERAPCGGGCITSSQCEAYSGTRNCRCAWFGCNLYTAEADLTDVEQFDIFIKQYSGNTKMLQSAESAYRTRQ